MFFSVLMIGVVAYFITYGTGTFELTGRAATAPDLVKLYESFTNGENLSIGVQTASPSVSNQVQVRFCLYQHQGILDVIGAMPTCLDEQNKLVDDNGVSWATFSRLPVLPGEFPENQYAIWACACLVNEIPECICNGAPVTTAYYEVESPYATLAVNDSQFCDYGVVSLYPTETNREWFNIQAINVETGEKVYDSYFNGGSNGASAFMPQRGATYDLYLYLCHDVNSGCENTPLDSILGYTTSTCGAAFDLGIYDITLPNPVVKDESFTAGINVSNVSDIDAGEVNITASIYNYAGIMEPIETQVGTLSSLAAGQSSTLSLTFGGLPVGRYVIRATLESEGDSRVDNNTYSEEFVVSGNVYCIDLACPVNQIRDPQSCDCVCDDSVCPRGKEMNTDCTACVCGTSCQPDQWQDANCACHSNSCQLTCGEGEILTPECTCQAVECTSDADCPNMEVCDLTNNTCVCTMSCYAGYKSNADCSQCVCATTCGTGEVQRSDCTCVSEGTELVSDPDEVKLEIVTPDDGKSVSINSKVVMTYRIDGNYDVDATLVDWYVDGVKVGTRNGVSYTASEAGEKEIVLKYDGREKDSVTITVVGDQTGADDDTSTTGTASIWKWVIYILGGLLLALLIAAWLISRRRDDDDEEEKKGMENRETPPTGPSTGFQS